MVRYSADSSCHANIEHLTQLFMMSLFDEIDKHPVASIFAIVWVIGVVWLGYSIVTAKQIDKDDKYF